MIVLTLWSQFTVISSRISFQVLREQEHACQAALSSAQITILEHHKQLKMPCYHAEGGVGDVRMLTLVAVKQCISQVFSAHTCFPLCNARTYMYNPAPCKGYSFTYYSGMMFRRWM